ncbi:MAG: stage III sporulation protein AA [Thermicanus sp.]|nr:stage III sporulation protein AA [Thermicanus sp.]
MLEELLHFLPDHIEKALRLLPETIRVTLEEVRLRAERPVEIISSLREGFLTTAGEITPLPSKGLIVSSDDMAHIINLMTNHSLYAMEEELRRGYLTLPGGHRIGLSGRAVLKGGRISHLHHITGLNLRLAREKIGSGEVLLPYIWNGKEIYNTLLISPPRAGKTTLIRDLARIFSYGESRFGISGMRVGVVDERSEIAGSYLGIPQKDVGPRTDVLDGCPKAEGMMMMIRSMSPQLLITDEIGQEEDVVALLEAVNAGIHLITTAHGEKLDEIEKRPILQKIFRYQVFQRMIFLSRRKGAGTVEAVYDGQGMRVTGANLR